MCCRRREPHLRGSGSRSRPVAASGGFRRQRRRQRPTCRVSPVPCRTGRGDPPYWSRNRRCLAAAARGGWRWRPWPGCERSRLRWGPQAWGVNELLTLVFSPPTLSTFRRQDRTGRGPESAVAAAAAGCSPRSRTGT